MTLAGALPVGALAISLRGTPMEGWILLGAVLGAVWLIFAS